MSFELVLALFASVVSIASFMFSIVSWRIQKNVSISAASLQAYAEIERSIASVPSALRFHGITPEMLQKHGVTPEEFAYLVSTFSAGYIYHYGVTPKDVKPSIKDSYRYNLLKSESTRRAWPLVRDMIGSGKYRDKLDATIELIKEQEKKTLASKHRA